MIDAGLVNAVYDDWPNFGHDVPRKLRFTQPGPGGPERGDRFGFALTSTGGSAAAVAVGSPGEDINAARVVADIGSISWLWGSTDFQSEGGGGLWSPGIWHTQNTLGGGSSSEAGDHFGGALASSGLH
ncbi:MAG TPA: hypothetical protein VKE25_04805 [Actinomycetes bacterium]|nr:hypothetical protein [Actinomycetes bacterium]